MSLLLLLRGSANRLGVSPALLTLSAPPATISLGGLDLQATPAVFNLIPNSPQLIISVNAAVADMSLSAPAASLVVSGTAQIQAISAVLTLVQGNASLSIDLTITIIQINGVIVTTQIEAPTVDVTDALDELPNTCNFTTIPRPSVIPLVGQEIKIGLGTINNLAFAGHIVTSKQIYNGGRENIIYEYSCVDYTRLLNRRKITKRYVNISASVIVIDIITNYTSGFTTTNVVLGLPLISVDFDLEDPTKALTEVAKLVGAYWYMAYDRDTHFFITETIDAPDDITELQHTVWDLDKELDINQWRSRILIEGGGSSLAADIPNGQVIIPVNSIDFFSSGKVKSGPQIFNYTGIFVGGIVAKVMSSVNSPGAPSATVIPGTGKVIGLTKYKISFKSDAGETLTGNPSNSVTGIGFTTPGAVTLAIASGLGRLIGAYSYRPTYVTDLGETDLGGTNSITASVASNPSPPSFLIAITSSIGPLIGLFQYVITNTTKYGETLSSGITSIVLVAVSSPGACSINLSSGIGPLIGLYQYAFTFVTPYGETTKGSISSRVASALSILGTFNAGNNGIGPLFGAYSWRIAFLSALGETLGTSSAGYTPGNYPASSPTVSNTGTGNMINYAVTYVHPIWGESAMSSIVAVRTSTFTITVNGLPSGCGWNIYSSGSYVSGSADLTRSLFKIAEMGVGVSGFTHAGESGPHGDVRPSLGYTVQLYNIQLGPTGTVTRKIYRTKAGGSTYLFVGQLNDNVTTVFNDNVPDNSLNALAPVLNLNGERHLLTSIPTGPIGTLARRIYRTKAGGSAFLLLTELQDNSSTSYIDSTADDDLSSNSPPLISTAGGQSVNIGVLPTGPAGTLTRRIYRTKSNGSAFGLVIEIGDNTTTSYIDSTPDESLGGNAPPVISDAGGQNIQLSSIPIGPAGTLARRIYRTKAGGGTYGLVGQISDNTTTTFLDDKIDSEIGNTAPVINDAGASSVQITSIAIGPTGTTSRRVYRLSSDGLTYKFVHEIENNTDTSYVDKKADTELGAVMPDEATLGALNEGTEIVITAAIASQFPNSGWAEVGSNKVFWASKSGNRLQGIPSSGEGMIKTNIRGGTEITALPLLTGVSGAVPGGTYPMKSGDSISIYITRDDVPAQGTIAALEGGDGIHEFPVKDSSLTLAASQIRGDAELSLFSKTSIQVTFRSRDTKLRTGKNITLNLGAPTNLVGVFKIQQVVIKEFGQPNTFPMRTVTASSYLYTLDHLLNRVMLLGD